MKFLNSRSALSACFAVYKTGGYSAVSWYCSIKVSRYILLGILYVVSLQFFGRALLTTVFSFFSGAVTLSKAIGNLCAVVFCFGGFIHLVWTIKKIFYPALSCTWGWNHSTRIGNIHFFIFSSRTLVIHGILLYVKTGITLTVFTSLWYVLLVVDYIDWMSFLTMSLVIPGYHVNCWIWRHVTNHVFWPRIYHHIHMYWIG